MSHIEVEWGYHLLAQALGESRSDAYHARCEALRGDAATASTRAAIARVVRALTEAESVE